MKPYLLYLNGKWVETADPITVTNPATGEALAKVCTVGRREVGRAFDDAEHAFPAWRALAGKERGNYLHRLADQVERRRDEMARTITQENGKPLPQSSGEVNMAVDHLRWFAEEGKRNYGRVIPRQVDGKRHMAIKTPIGVVGAITPWNFPLVLAVRKLAPALAAGCPVVLKPASQTPLCTVALAECAHEAGLPPGVFQLVIGPSREIGSEFLENPHCRKITFTGSTEIGRELIRGAADKVKPLSLELGGHAPLLVFEDADRETAIRGTLLAKFRNTGQSCIAVNRIYVQRSIYEEFLEHLSERTRELKVGNGLEENVEIGPLIDEGAVKKAMGHIEDAVARGGRVVCGGNRITSHGGYFMEPTLLADVPDDAACMQEETFAPVAPIAPFDSESEGIERANQSLYGLSAYVFTKDLNRSLRIPETLEAGTIGVNDGVPTTSQAPFGGVKQSGWGRELGSEGLDAFLETKHVSFGGL